MEQKRCSWKVFLSSAIIMCLISGTASASLINEGKFENGFVGGWFISGDVDRSVQVSADDLVRFGATTINNVDTAWGTTNNPPFNEPRSAFLSQDNIDLTGVPAVKVSFDYRFVDSGNDSFKVFFGLKEKVGFEGLDGNRDLSDLQSVALNPQAWTVGDPNSGFFTTTFSLNGLDLTGKSGVLAFVYNEQDQLPSDTMNNSALAIIRDVQVHAVPIPGAVFLLGTGIVGLAALRRKVQK